MTPSLLKVALIGNSILRTPASPVYNVHDPEIQRLIDDMIATCKESNGVGIAAPQVYRSLRLFIVASKPNARYPNAPSMEPTAIINPDVLESSDELENGWEGCLSIPLRGIVSRHKSIRVAFINRSGQRVEQRFEGFIARVFQHEFDHINGTLFVDRAHPLTLCSEEEFAKISQVQ